MARPVHAFAQRKIFSGFHLNTSNHSVHPPLLLLVCGFSRNVALLKMEIFALIPHFPAPSSENRSHCGIHRFSLGLVR